MELFSTVETTEHEQVVFFHSKDTGLKAIIAIHNTVLGPALGGSRLWAYQSEAEALNDVLRLSRGMTYKAAVSGLNLGGGKAVIIADPQQKSEALFRAFGRYVDSLGGRYITAEDVNTSVEDMDHIFQETDHVVGVHPAHGGSGDPSPWTALGTVQGIKASLEKKYGHKDLAKASYAVQGLGHVGFYVVERLRKAGAKVYVPCALGATVNEKTIPQFKFEVIAGAANNQLADERCGDEIHRKGIVYAPDYAINAGGLMNVSLELAGYNRVRAEKMVMGIYDNIARIYKLADKEGITSFRAADRLAEQRIAAMGKVKLPHVKQSADRLSGRSRAVSAG